MFTFIYSIQTSRSKVNYIICKRKFFAYKERNKDAVYTIWQIQYDSYFRVFILIDFQISAYIKMKHFFNNNKKCTFTYLYKRNIIKKKKL